MTIARLTVLAALTLAGLVGCAPASQPTEPTGDGDGAVHDLADASAAPDLGPEVDAGGDDTGEEDTASPTAGLCDETHPDWTVGLLHCSPQAWPGYTLLAPQRQSDVYLIDMWGRQVHHWDTEFTPGNAVYLEDDGSLLVTANVAKAESDVFKGGGQGGRVQTYSWSGELLWDYDYADDDVLQHHDIARLPNGHVLLVAWEYKGPEEVLAAGRDPAGDPGAMWPDHLVEVDPSTDSVVWEWHLWDHLIQDIDPSLPGYGVVAEHPELMDINLGAKGSGGPGGGSDDLGDWNHTNAVAYHPGLDQIVLSLHHQSEIIVIDHSTTTEEAAGHAGGRYGRGGDILYRWGNPANYGAGSPMDQQLDGQHDAHWIAEGLPGEGHILIFNNKAAEKASAVVEIAPPVDSDGGYGLAGGEAYAPTAPAWTYMAPDPMDFYSSLISSAQRLVNGHTLVCSGAGGRLFEVTADGEVVWEYINPITKEGPATQGDVLPAGDGPNDSAGNQVFRAYRFGLDHPAFEGRDLTPVGYLETVGI